MKFLLTSSLLTSHAMLVAAWVAPLPFTTTTTTSSGHRRSSITTTTTQRPMAVVDDDIVGGDVDGVLDNLKQLLEHLSDGPDGGQKLYAASSPSWQAAIQAAVGAPDTADAKLVADALQQAMARPHNQFAILMGGDDAAQDFQAVFPTEPVVNDNQSLWVECQLRDTATDKLLVDMGLNLILNQGEWKIDDLQWQDFRDAFYPGLSGREWLRAF